MTLPLKGIEETWKSNGLAGYVALLCPNDFPATDGALRGQRNSSGALGATYSILRLQKVSRRKHGILEFPVTEGATVLMYTMAPKEAKDPVISCERKERSTMGDIRVAVRKSPIRIKITDSDALMEHAQVLQLRSRCHDLIDQDLRPAHQRVEEAKLRLREAEVAEEQVKLALDAIGLQERKAVERFFAAVRNATPKVRSLAERYGGDVSLTFDSDGRSVWVVALFGKSAPPSLRTVPDEAVSWPSVYEDQEDSSTEEEEDES